MPSLPASCPRCSLDLAAYASLSDSIVTCPSCQFPLILIAGKYRLTSLLAQGGVGSLYMAKHITLEKEAERVVKIISPLFLQQRGMRERFWREVQVTSALSQRNPHIVRVFDDFGEIPKLGGFYVMEYLCGRSLKDTMMDFPVPSREWAFEIMRQLCEVMQEAHDDGIVHRDLKPDNLFLVTYRKQEFFLKVLDFGIAKPFLEGSDLARVTQGILGTPAYIAPEQVTQRPIDPRTDLYSMALIFYELLTGQIPFFTPEQVRTLNPLGILSSRLTSPQIPPPHLVRPDLGIPEALSFVICKALSLLPEDRPPSVAAFWKEIQNATELRTSPPQILSFSPPYTPTGASAPLLYSASALPLASASSPSEPPLTTAEWPAPSPPPPKSAPPQETPPPPPPVAAFVMHPPFSLHMESALPSASQEEPEDLDHEALLPAQKRRRSLLLGLLGCFFLLTFLLLLFSAKPPLTSDVSHEPRPEDRTSLALQTKAGKESALREQRPPEHAGASGEAEPNPSEGPDSGQAGAEPLPPKRRPPSPPPASSQRPLKIRKTPPHRRLKGPKKAVQPSERLPSVRARKPPPQPESSPCGEGFVFLRTSPKVSLKDLLVSEAHRAASRAVLGGLCLPKGIGDVGVERDGYELCRFRIGHKRSSLSLWLKEKDTPSAFESCLRP